MKPQLKKLITVSVLTAGAFAFTHAEAAENGLYYNNRGFTNVIPGDVNSVSDVKSENPRIVYVNLAYGPAVYSYPVNTPSPQTEFNMTYVDMAYGPAIYSYPRNGQDRHIPKHRLHLGANSRHRAASGAAVPTGLSGQGARTDAASYRP